jgi:hypothetical protein
MKLTTLCYVFGESRKTILLAFKKRGFGQGMWNGPGGKVHFAIFLFREFWIDS